MNYYNLCKKFIQWVENDTSSFSFSTFSTFAGISDSQNIAFNNFLDMKFDKRMVKFDKCRKYIKIYNDYILTKIN